jgi:hypothetical protein
MMFPALLVLVVRRLSVVEAGRHGAVDDIVAELHPDAAEDLGVHHDVELDLAVVQPAQCSGQPISLLFTQVDGGPDHRHEALPAISRDLLVVLEGQLDRALTGGHRVHSQGDRRGRRLAFEQRPDERLAVLGGHLAVGDRVTELGVPQDHAAEPEQLVLELGQLARALRGDDVRKRCKLFDGIHEVACRRPARAGGSRDDVDGVVAQLGVEDRTDQLLPGIAAGRRIGQRTAQSGLVPEQTGYREELRPQRGCIARAGQLLDLRHRVGEPFG